MRSKKSSETAETASKGFFEGNKLRNILASPAVQLVRGQYLPMASQPPAFSTFSFFLKLHCKKTVFVFSVPSRDVTNQTLPGWELLNYSQPGSLVSDIPAAGDGKNDDLFLLCIAAYCQFFLFLLISLRAGFCNFLFY
jgi:hypothetical protein